PGKETVLLHGHQIQRSFMSALAAISGNPHQSFALGSDKAPRTNDRQSSKNSSASVSERVRLQPTHLPCKPAPPRRLCRCVRPVFHAPANLVNGSASTPCPNSHEAGLVTLHFHEEVNNGSPLPAQAGSSGGHRPLSL